MPCSVGSIPLTILSMNNVLISSYKLKLSTTAKVDMPGQIVQHGKERTFSYDVESAVESRVWRHVVNTASAVAAFICKEGSADQFRSSAIIEDAERHHYQF